VCGSPSSSTESQIAPNQNDAQKKHLTDTLLRLIVHVVSSSAFVRIRLRPRSGAVNHAGDVL